jgi:hypothetical protein
MENQESGDSFANSTIPQERLSLKPIVKNKLGPLEREIPSFSWIFFLIVYSIAIGYCLMVQINQERTILNLKSQLSVLQTALNASVKIDENPQLWSIIEDRINERIFTSFNEVNGSSCTAIARNCAVDFIKYVPTSFIYSSITRCGQLVGLA